MLVSISEGFCLEGLLGAILLREGDDIFAAGGFVGGGSSSWVVVKMRNFVAGDFGRRVQEARTLAEWG